LTHDSVSSVSHKPGFSQSERFANPFTVKILVLAIDRNEKFVVIELKLSQGRNKALGQQLYYMGWVDRHLCQGPCRGFIIASEISEELSVAVSRVTGVQLAEYHPSFAIEPVEPT